MWIRALQRHVAQLRPTPRHLTLQTCSRLLGPEASNGGAGLKRIKGKSDSSGGGGGAGGADGGGRGGGGGGGGGGGRRGKNGKF